MRLSCRYQYGAQPVDVHSSCPLQFAVLSQLFALNDDVSNAPSTLRHVHVTTPQVAVQFSQLSV